MSDAPLLPQPVFGAPGQILDAVCGEELRSCPVRGALLGHSLGTVLAELGGVAMARVGVRPGAAHAIEALGLVQFEQRLGGPDRPHVAEGAFHRDGDGGGARCMGLRLLDVELREIQLVVLFVHVRVRHVGLLRFPSPSRESGSDNPDALLCEACGLRQTYDGDFYGRTSRAI